ncbi:MAG TPA: hypothetical protein VGK47_07550 [Nitrososphaeraceae archaeon]
MINIYQQPQVFTPAGNDMSYVVKSDNIAQTNFKYIFDIYINGVFVTQELRSQHPTYGTGVLDIKKIVSPSVLSDFLLTDTDGVTKNTQSFCTVQVRFGEQYGSTVTNYQDLTRSNTIYAFAGSIKTLDFVDWDYHDYYAGDVDQGKFLTTRSRVKHVIKQSQKDWLSIYTNSSGNVETIGIHTYDHTGTGIQVFEFLNPFSSLGQSADRFIKFAAGWNLNDISPASVTVGAQPCLTANVAYFEVHVVDQAAAPTAEILKVYVEQSCAWGDEYDLHFQNSLGFQESFRFTKWTSKNEDYDRKNFKKPTGTYGNTSFTVTTSDRGWETYYSKTANRWILRSDWINDEMIPWVGEIIGTKQAYLDINNELIPVIIENTNYEQITKQTNQLRNLELTVRLPDDYR